MGAWGRFLMNVMMAAGGYPWTVIPLCARNIYMAALEGASVGEDELREDSNTLAARLREAHDVCDEHRDIATASLIEVWIDETERRAWFLFEASRQGDSSGH